MELETPPWAPAKTCYLHEHNLEKLMFRVFIFCAQFLAVVLLFIRLYWSQHSRGLQTMEIDTTREIHLTPVPARIICERACLLMCALGVFIMTRPSHPIYRTDGQSGGDGGHNSKSSPFSNLFVGRLTCSSMEDYECGFWQRELPERNLR